MPSLAELKAKWFIAMDGSAPDGVPWRRHSTGTPNDLADSTDGNAITILIDGKNYMEAWHDAVVALHGAAGAEIYHAGWRLEGVKTLGESDAASDALELLDDAGENSVTVRVLLSDHMSGLNLNQLSSTWLLAHFVTTMLDNRYPPGGTNHFKYTILKQASGAFAFLGSLDISKTRWDDSRHLAANAERNPTLGKATHDLGVRLDGPVISDLEKTFRERWNDPGYNIVFPSITTPLAAPAAAGTHSIQVLRTYGTAADLAYSWSSRGEFTVWASYLNAIKKATRYIYVEDQYFLPFDWPPAFNGSGPARDTDLVFQLGEAIKRGVLVCAVTPSNAEDIGKSKSKYHRDLGINYLRQLVIAGAAGDFVVAALQNGTGDVYVHSKLMIVDDELVLLGNANFGQRSMTCDGEMQLAIVDSAEGFARDLRVALWSEHLFQNADSDPITAFAALKAGVASQTGHLKPYPTDENAIYPATASSTQPERGHAAWMRNVFDPYYGPRELR
jgi:phosphatidylserine/phosphatidylglycerophosphate/cardiolipin synthase-like enzyme